ncbi:serine-rich adhesin for platelets isoform X2 [Drosophila busckii]|nr:serine-rich adhesin for platelets isoform X2 [Drosophila busckii]XP_017848789.1 serine-rich adhesin for platelets isoform X2 [Drosophila busckii]
MTTTNASNSSSTTTTVTQQQTQQQQSSGSTTSKVYIKKTGSSSNSSASGRKESFGSRDSLNDILSETGLPVGTVAAQRKSLENKNLDLSKLPGSKSSSTTITTTTNSSSSSSSTSAYTELRKSLDNMDEKLKSPPPVVSKKPSVPLKKTPTGGVPVLGGSGLKKKSTDGKLTSAVSHDIADGMAGSKLSADQLPEAGAPGNVIMRRAATIAGEDTEFDRVERASILTDMRAGRVKAPKRRPPSAAIIVLGESNNNSVYVNGSGMASSASELSEDGGAGKQASISSDDNSTSEEPQLAKPKPREWEKKKAPWMEELKASQVSRKKTSPVVEPRSGAVTVAERTSKLFPAEPAAATNSSSSSNSVVVATTKVQSSAVTSSSIMQQSMFVESSSSSTSQKKESSSSSSTTTTVVNNDAIMSKSMSATKAPTSAAALSSDEESRAARPNSLALRNRSVSPLVRTANASSSTQQQQQHEKSNNVTASDRPTTTTTTAQSSNHTESAAAPPRVQQLEGRVDKLEALVQAQQRTIEELVRTLREETERVKLLRGELDKYAHKQTQSRRGKFDNWMF